MLPLSMPFRTRLVSASAACSSSMPSPSTAREVAFAKMIACSATSRLVLAAMNPTTSLGSSSFHE